jgi:26S proteasome regulatory subunit N5
MFALCLPSVVSSFQPAALPDVLANLLALEKKTRLAADAKSTVVVCNAILQACWDCKDWAQLNAHLSILTKRRAQLQKAMEAVIQQGARYVKLVDVSTADGEAKQRELIETLRTVSAGKMFVELERAQLTAILAAQEEKAGRVKEAADILQEIQVRQATRDVLNT